MYLFDSNIFLEILLQQERADAAQKVLEEMSSNRPGIVTGFALHAIEVISTRAGEFDVLSKFMQFLRNHPFLKRYDTTTEEEVEICRRAPLLSLDFDDALHHFVAEKYKLVLITFDGDFRNKKGIQVLFPK